MKYAESLYEKSLYFAAKNAHIDIAKALYNTDVNIHVSDEYDKNTSSCCCQEWDNEVVQHLVEKGADVNAKNYFNDSSSDSC